MPDEFDAWEPDLPLLLILSALLSALTGALGSVRAVEVGQHQASGPTSLERAMPVAATPGIARAFDQRRFVRLAGLLPRIPAIAAWPGPVARYTDRRRE